MSVYTGTVKVVGADGRIYLLDYIRLGAVDRKVLEKRQIPTGGKGVSITTYYDRPQAVVDLYGSISSESAWWIISTGELKSEKARKDAIAKQQAQAAAKAKALTTNKSSGAAKNTNSSNVKSGSFVAAFSTEKSKADWNLPPHKWSLPLSAENGKYEVVAKNENRRGKIFFYAYGENQKVMKYVQNKRPGGKPLLQAEPVTRNDSRAYGFQFMWNPESYVVQNALMTEATPSKEDLFVSGHGMFPGASHISFTVRLDRTNDMAALLNNTTFDDAGLYNYYYLPDELPYNNRLNDRANPGTTKLEWLRKYGTMADVEYLYRVCNDIQNVNRTRADGFISADVGYLGFALAGIELGPMSYTGYITGITVNHITFNENYVPIRTDVSISANVMAVATGTSLATKVG